MPISKINPDGTVDVYNSKTGQVQNGVKPESLGAISPRLVAEYQGMQAPEQVASRLEAEKKITELQAGGVEDTGTSEQKFRMKSALNAIDRLEQTYGRGKNENVGGKDDLSLSPSATVLGKVKGKASAGIKSLFDSRFQEDLNIYTSALQNAKGIFTQAFGSGTPQAFESETLLQNAPNASSTDREVTEWFKTVRAFLGKNDLPTATTGGVESETAKMAAEVGQKKNEPQGGVNLRDIAIKAADTAPVVMGTTAGLIGSALGSVGALAGAGGGTAGGMVVKQKVRDLLGAQSKTPMQQLEELKNDVTKNVALETLGLGAGKFILEPLAKVGGYALKVAGKTVEDIPTQAFRFAPSDITNFAHKHAEGLADFIVKRGFLGDDALDIAAGHAQKFQEAFDNLALNKNIQIPIGKVGQRFSDEISELAGKGSRIVPSAAKNIAQSVLKEWDNIVEQSQRMGKQFVTPEELTLFRRTIDDLIPDSQWIDPGIKNTNIRVRRIINDVVSDAVEGRLLGEGGKGTMKDLGKELSKVYDFLEFAEKRAGKGKGSLVANLTRILTSTAGAGLGFSAGGPTGAVVGAGAGLAAETALRDPNVLKGILSAANVARKAGKALSPAMEAALRAAGPAMGAAGQMFATQ